MGTETKKYKPEPGRADRLHANLPEFVAGAKQFPNPKHLMPMLDTDRPMQMHQPMTPGSVPGNIENAPLRSPLEPPVERKF